MIHLLAQDILKASQAEDSSPASWRNVAIGLLSEPAFINKDQVIRRWLSSRSDASEQTAKDDVKLCWLVGTDTVERFFDQKCPSSHSCTGPATCSPACAHADPFASLLSPDSLQTTLNRSRPAFRPSSTLQRRAAFHPRSSFTSPVRPRRRRPPVLCHLRRRSTTRRSPLLCSRLEPFASAKLAGPRTGAGSARPSSGRVLRPAATTGASWWEPRPPHTSSESVSIGSVMRRRRLRSRC